MASDRRKKRLSVGWALATTSDGRHHHDETAAAAPPPPVLTEQNDDEEERRLARQRRQSINAAASPRVRRKSVLASTLFSGADAEEEVENTNATSNLPPAELAALYQNCIKLSEQGKINIKNTWSLPLIEGLGRVLEVGQNLEMPESPPAADGDENSTTSNSAATARVAKQRLAARSGRPNICNFQVASCTLEASVKIYSTRVDSVHNDAYRVVSGLSRTQDDAHLAGDQKDLSAAAVAAKERKERRAMRTLDASHTLESNPANLEMKQTELDFDVDPLFHKKSAEFDKGGARGLLLHQLGTSDGCTVVFDSTQTLDGEPETAPVSEEQDDDRMIELSFIDACLDRSWEEIASLELCPPLSDFQFSGWQADKDPTGLECLNQESHARGRDSDALSHSASIPTLPEFNVEMVEADLEDLEGFDGADIGGGDYDLGGDDGGDFDDEGGARVPGDGNDNLLFGNADGFFGGGAAGAGSNYDGALSGFLAAPIGGELGRNVLTLDVMDLLPKADARNWTGTHWKFFTAAKAAPTASKDSTETVRKRKKKDDQPIDFASEDTADYNTLFSKPKRGTTLTATTLKKHAAVTTTLPTDVHYDVVNLTRLFCKPNCKIARVRQTLADDTTDNVQTWYDYDNPNDKAPFGADGDMGEEENAGGIDDGDMGGLIDFNAGDDDDDDGFGMLDAGDDDSRPAAPAGTSGAASGFELIDEPERLEALSIGYAKVAKLVDVKKLKHSLWNELCDDESADGSQGANNKTPKSGATEHMSTTKSFQDVLQALPPSLPQKQRKDISVPYCFICLLHLANEKGLEIVADGKDLRISQV